MFPTKAGLAPFFCGLLLACGGGAATPTQTTPPSPSATSTPPRISLHLAGDSTMGEGLEGRRPETGWGEELQPLFHEDRLQVRNYAKRGRSTRTFISEGFWAALIPNVREGDYVIVQFGLVTEHGVEGSKDLFQHLSPGQHPNYPEGLADNIHLSPKGASLLAQRAAKGLREMNSPLAAHLK
jgi:lysophospholipase L1-like esterase